MPLWTECEELRPCTTQDGLLLVGHAVLQHAVALCPRKPPQDHDNDA